MHEFELRIRSQLPADLPGEVTTVVAVSGGADSVALLRGMAALLDSSDGERLVAAHFDHRLRTNSGEDASFVMDLCGELEVACEVGSASGLESGSDGIEAAAREARYGFLKSIASRVGARYVVTAHTADDQVETILHRIVRGTGLSGLAGIPRTRVLDAGISLLRPLLTFRRVELLAYLDSIGQSFREDVSNRDERFTRNRIRHRLLPELRDQFNANVDNAITRLGKLAEESQRVIDSIADELRNRCVTLQSADRVLLQCDTLADQPQHLVCELLVSVWRQQNWSQQSMGFEEWTALAQIVASRVDRVPYTFPGAIIAQKKGGQLTLTARSDSSTK